MSGTDTAVIIVTILVIRFLRLLFRDTSYIGYGWKLSWREGEVYVVSRLLKSPSGRADVHIGSVLRKYRGEDLDFETVEDFIAFMRSNPRPKLGQVEEFTIWDGYKERAIAMQAERIHGPIPFHRPLPPIDPADEWRYRHGMFLCQKTGQIVFTRSLSDAGLRALYA